MTWKTGIVATTDDLLMFIWLPGIAIASDLVAISRYMFKMIHEEATVRNDYTNLVKIRITRGCRHCPLIEPSSPTLDTIVVWLNRE